MEIYRKPNNCHWLVFAKDALELLDFLAEQCLGVIKPVDSIYNDSRDPAFCNDKMYIITSGTRGEEVADAYFGVEPSTVISTEHVLCSSEVPHCFFPGKDWSIVK